MKKRASKREKLTPQEDARFRRVAWERVTKIDALLRAKKFPNCVQMARDFGVSVRTLKRDIQFMIERRNLPIKYDEKRWGYYYDGPVDTFPQAPMSEAEIFALLVAHKAVAQYHGTPFEKPLRMAFEKLTEKLDGKELYMLENLGEVLSFRLFAAEETDMRMFKALTRALLECRTVTFGYKNYGPKPVQQRRGNPYHLACIDNAWYLFAYDLDRKDMRTFALSRLSDPRVTDERFARPKKFSPAKDLEGSLGAMKGDRDFEVVIEFDAYGTDLVRGRRLHSSQNFTELADGRSQLKMRLSGLEEIERSVLSWGSHATVVKPKALAEGVRKTAEELVTRYAEA
jgi:proteasome accessory factor B